MSTVLEDTKEITVLVSSLSEGVKEVTERMRVLAVSVSKGAASDRLVLNELDKMTEILGR